MKVRLFLANVFFLVHFIIVAFWFGLFFVPSSIWPAKITFHFYLTVLIVAHQFIWGLIIMPWTKKFRLVCILTTPMQLLRGQKISDPKNYDHSWFKELFGKGGIKIPHAVSTLATFTTLALVTYQFIFLR